MKKRVDLSQIFPKYVFWDADPSRLDVERDLGLIIPRALFVTDETNFEMNIQKLENLYSKETILSTLQYTRENISNKVCELVAKRYQVEPFYRWSIK
ncbi:hypothetical protein SAMN05216464_1109 [Mucilaginibacter pineti]|uniref:DUF6922 domain-containing protein n=1 Tax=Mucilaginibacter pineti TaxID=1391627 RepID=A0A1G7G7Q8_9SPHI|nr:hypothetical protein [Mucilaginibacter pineti]SDE84151.1 hypothetical protein SAMN05216464_1109 [Mucilaginibacter pineti]